jgi:hypothetical protein
MDPDAALARLRELLDPAKVDAVLNDINTQDGHAEHLLNEACDVFSGLDDWISKGGALPKAWER